MLARLLFRSPFETPPGRYRYIQPETQKPFDNFPTFDALKAAVRAHRQGNNLPIGTDFDAELQDWMCRHMPDADVHCYEQGRNPSEQRLTGPRGISTGYDGREKWKELHVFALIATPGSVERAAWLVNFANSLPCGECKQGWKKLCSQHPLPQNASTADFFAWTVAMHNRVNEKLGKAQISVEEAREIWMQ